MDGVTVTAVWSQCLTPFSANDLVVEAFASGAEDPGFESRFRRDSPGRVIAVTYTLALQWLPFQAPGVIGSALGLFGPVSVHCD